MLSSTFPYPPLFRKSWLICSSAQNEMSFLPNKAPICQLISPNQLPLFYYEYKNMIVLAPHALIRPTSLCNNHKYDYGAQDQSCEPTVSCTVATHKIVYHLVFCCKTIVALSIISNQTCHAVVYWPSDRRNKWFYLPIVCPLY